MQSQSKILKWSVIIGIVIVANMFINYSLSLVYQEPQYNDFCTQTEITSPSANIVCSNNYTTAENNFQAKVFVTLVSIGVLLIIVSFFLKGNTVLGSAFSLSGIFSLVIASFRYWSSAYGWMRVVILGIALIALIYLALRKFKNETLRP